jgi:hypothetical protein
MRIFFGKITPKTNPLQFEQGFYETDTPKMFGDIDVGDFAFAISGSRIELWKAKTWSKNKHRLDFDKVITTFDWQTNKLIAFKYFKIDAILSVITVRSSPNAFFEIHQAKYISEQELSNFETYRDEENFRKIIVYKKEEDCNSNAEDVQIYIDNSGKINLFKSPFLDEKSFANFEDHTSFIGKGQSKKDSTLKIFKEIKSFPTVFTYDQVNLRQLYDAFAVPYKSNSTLFEEDVPDVPASNLNENLMKRSLNTILFGPPGTGKTYHSIHHALSIVEERSIEETLQEPREEVTRRYKAYVERGQIVFTTFHQSMSYEDFIEGIKPAMETEPNTSGPQPLGYHIQPGVFRQICQDAQSFQFVEDHIQEEGLNISVADLEKADFYKMSLGDTYDPQDQQVFEHCIKNNCIALGWGGDIDFTSAKNEEDIKKLYQANGVEIKPRDFGVFAIKCFKFWLKEGDLVFISNGNASIRALAKISGPYYFDTNSGIGYNQFRKVEWVSKNLQLPVLQIYPRRFSQQSIYGLYSHEVKRDVLKELIKKPDIIKKNYVLIIDEINRGNISQIFGELITLIEEDKRLGKEEALTVTLPYSKEPFGVPPNLYIIGTMNTADRSVEALDTALRRRFSFEEMPPKYDLEGLEGELFGYPAKDILYTINARIQRLLDKDHLIGHAYFLNKDEDALITAFYKNIIPLLQEYFFGDYGKIGLVLGKGFVRKKEFKDTGFADFEDYQGANDFDQRDIFEIIDLKDNKEGFRKAIELLMRIMG